MPEHFTIETGVKASISLDVFRGVANIFYDKLMEAVSVIAVPDFSSDDYTMGNNSFGVEQRKAEVTLSSDVGKNAIVLNCKQLTAKFKSRDVSYFNAYGSVEVDMNSVDIGFGL